MKMIYIDAKTKNSGHYTPAVASNGMLYVSGQLGMNPDTGKLPEGGIKTHTMQALSNLDRVLKAAGTDRTKVVQCRIYLPDIMDWDEVNKLYSDFFGEHKPARAIVPTRELHYGSLIEIEAVAELEEER